jgi:hypothetical protein
MSSRLLTTVALATLSFGAAGVSLAQGQAPAYRPAMAMFDGKNSAAFPASPGLDVSSVATIEMWVAPKWTGQLGYDPFLVTYMGQKGPRFSVVMSGDQKAIGILSGDDSDYAEFDFSDGKAHHVAFVFVGDVADVFIDGVLISTLAIKIAELPASHFILGSANGTDLAFKGGLADVRIWNTALDQNTIVAWRFADPLAPSAKHPAANSLIGRSVFTNGRRGFALAQPPLSPETEALLKSSQEADEPPAPLASEDEK